MVLPFSLLLNIIILHTNTIKDYNYHTQTKALGKCNKQQTIFFFVYYDTYGFPSSSFTT
eukprot:m.46079 g.46079  ORF g.46079 m.46079 type:complete len:59 (-) comp7249_c0_seq1:1559-1735(-)